MAGMSELPEADSAAGGAAERGTLIVADLPIEGIWTQLSLWESQALAAKLVRTKAEGLPELKDTYEYVTDRPALSFGIAHSFYNHEEAGDGLEGIGNIFGEVPHGRAYT